MERLYIDGNNARFRRRGLTTVDMELCDGRILENLEPRRLFPYTMPSACASASIFRMNATLSSISVLQSRIRSPLSLSVFLIVAQKRQKIKNLL